MRTLLSRLERYVKDARTTAFPLMKNEKAHYYRFEGFARQDSGEVPMPPGFAFASQDILSAGVADFRESQGRRAMLGLTRASFDEANVLYPTFCAAATLIDGHQQKSGIPSA